MVDALEEALVAVVAGEEDERSTDSNGQHRPAEELADVLWEALTAAQGLIGKKGNHSGLEFCGVAGGAAVLVAVRSGQILARALKIR